MTQIWPEAHYRFTAGGSEERAGCDGGWWGGWRSCGDLLPGITALWLNEDHLFNTRRSATINQRKVDYLNRGRWVLKWLRLPEAEVYCLAQGHREVSDVRGYQILWKPEWSNEMSDWPCTGFSHARIFFVTHFLLENLRFETSPGLQRTISLMVEGQDLPRIHEGCKRSVHSPCVNRKLLKNCWIVYLVTVQMLDLGDYYECAQKVPFFPTYRSQLYIPTQ